MREQDGRGAGGCGVGFSPWIHQEHTFRHRSACRTPDESGQEYLTGGKEYIQPPIRKLTVARLAHQTPDALSYRVGPHPGCP